MGDSQHSMKKTIITSDIVSDSKEDYFIPDSIQNSFL